LKGKAASTGTLDLATAGLDPGTYAWRVRAKYADDAKWSAWSEPGAFVVAQPIQNRLDELEDETVAVVRPSDTRFLGPAEVLAGGI
jgi:hypothetical protein